MSAFILMFRQVRVPGSPSAELIRLSTPEALDKYRAVNPDLPDVILDWRDEALAHDRFYAMSTRVLGSIELAATIVAVGYLALHNRF
jgi:hypothetical protein